MDTIHRHGGDIYGLPGGRAGRNILDFSANISPLGLPRGVLEAIRSEAYHFDVYPDPLCRELRGALEKHHHTSKDRILCGNGAADVIYRIVQWRKPKKALVLSPTFSEYEKALGEAGTAVERYALGYPTFRADERILPLIAARPDIVFLCNPNNPTGLVLPRELIKKIIQACGENKALLVIDECFNEFLDDPEAHSAIGLLACSQGLIILKAFTKLYAMAGFRLGYALCGSPEDAEGITATGQTWSVSAIAQTAGLAALKETAYVEELRQLVRTERAVMKTGLAALGLEVLGGEANYLFFKVPPASGFDPASLFQSLLDKGILIRSCANYPGLDNSFYRIAIRKPGENRTLLDTLRAMYTENF